MLFCLRESDQQNKWKESKRTYTNLGMYSKVTLCKASLSCRSNFQEKCGTYVKWEDYFYLNVTTVEAVIGLGDYAKNNNHNYFD